MNFLLGMNAKLYIGASVTDPAEISVAALSELDNVKDVTLNTQAGEADITTRANKGWRGTAPTLRECTLDFQMVWKPNDTGFAAVKQAFLTSGEVAMAALTGDVEDADAEGPVGNFTITNFSRSEALEEAIVVDVTAKLSKFGYWYPDEGGSGSS